ncbi:ProQ/FINO family protein [Jeongeupia wiesaeckerbachi]|uniref:ProQ/FINO family protein n=1 Tax=Jeongeupia wiesaeckerbachi TaxID=3051218 RepID=UPI003D807E3D
MTEPLNRKQKLAEERKVAFAMLAEHWPAVFDLKQTKPLALDTRDRLKAECETKGLDADKIARAVFLWVRRPAYQAAMAAGGQRYALDGTPTGEMTAEQQAHAAAASAAIQARIKAANEARIAAVREARRAEQEARREERAKQAPKPRPAGDKPAGAKPAGGKPFGRAAKPAQARNAKPQAPKQDKPAPDSAMANALAAALGRK